MHSLIKLLQYLLLACALASFNALAKDRVLLIGVNVYQNNALFQPMLASLALPGVAFDVELMREALVEQGVDPAAIKTISGEDATYTKIIQGIHQWLISGVSKTDRVILYYSGHGSKVYDFSGDEQDGLDEVILASDARFERQENDVVLSNVIVDDELSTLISRIPSANKLLIVDACYSGGVAKSFFMKSRFYPKFAFNKHAFRSLEKYQRQVTTRRASVARDEFPATGYVMISAAKEDEIAVSTDSGSVFTMAVHNSWTNGGPIKLQNLLHEVGKYIHTKLAQTAYEHSPQLSGDEALYEHIF